MPNKKSQITIDDDEFKLLVAAGFIQAMGLMRSELPKSEQFRGERVEDFFSADGLSVVVQANSMSALHDLFRAPNREQALRKYIKTSFFHNDDEWWFQRLKQLLNQGDPKNLPYMECRSSVEEEKEFREAYKKWRILPINIHK